MGSQLDQVSVEVVEGCLFYRRRVVSGSLLALLKCLGGVFADEGRDQLLGVDLNPACQLVELVLDFSFAGRAALPHLSLDLLQFFLLSLRHFAQLLTFA